MKILALALLLALPLGGCESLAHWYLFGRPYCAYSGVC